MWCDCQECEQLQRYLVEMCTMILLPAMVWSSAWDSY